MNIPTDMRAADGTTGPRRRADGTSPRPGRMWYLGSCLVLMLTWPIGLALFVIWAVVVSLSVLTIIAPLLVPIAAAIRGYARKYRHWASQVLGEQLNRPQQLDRDAQMPQQSMPASHSIPTSSSGLTRPTTQKISQHSFFEKLVAVLRDPATWREWLWLPVNATVGFGLAIIPVALLLGTGFYLFYPLLYAVTPQHIFGNAFGIIELHSMSGAWLMTPLAIGSFALWYVSVRALPLAYAKIIRAMLAAHHTKVLV